MSDWSTIKKGFIEWLKTQDSNFKETDKDYAPIKYSEKFKLYIEKHDNDDSVNMDSFTKSTADSKTLFDNMFDDYISGLDSSDVVFKAIDGLVDGKKDGKISTEEKNIFLTKVASAGFDGDIKNLSFDDLYAAITKIKSGDVSFLEISETTSVNSVNGVNKTDSTNGVNGTGATDGVSDLTNEQMSSIQALSSLITTWAEPVEVHKVSSALLTTGQVNSDIFRCDADDGENMTELQMIEHEIATGEIDLINYTRQYETSSSRLNQASAFNEVNEAAFSEICNVLMQSNEQFAAINNQITSINESITSTESAIGVQCASKDALAISLSSLDSSIWDINSQIANAQEGTNTSELQAKLSAAKESRTEVAKQLEQISEEILANKALLEKSYDDLDIAYRNLEQVDVNNSKLSDNQKALYSVIIENKRVITQQQKLMDVAKASMVASDSYIQALYARKEELLIKEKEEAALQEKENDEELNEQEKAKIADSVVNDEDGIRAQKNKTAEILENVNNVSGLVNPDTLEKEELDKSEDAPKATVYTINGTRVKITYSDADANGNYRCSVEVFDSNNNSVYNTNNHTFTFITDNLSYEYALAVTLSGEHSMDYGLEVTNEFDKWGGSTLVTKDKDRNVVSTRTIEEVRYNDERKALDYTSVIETDANGNETTHARIKTILDEENNIVMTIQEGKTDEDGNYVPLSSVRNTRDIEGYQTKKEIISYTQEEIDGEIKDVEQIDYTKIYEYEDEKISSITTYKGTQEGIVDELTDYDYTDGLKVTSSKNDGTGALASKITTIYDENEKISSVTVTKTGTSVQDDVEYTTENITTVIYDENGKIKSQTGIVTGTDKDGNTLERVVEQDGNDTTLSIRDTENKNGISTTIYTTEAGSSTIKLAIDGTTITKDNYSEILSSLKTAIDNNTDNSTTLSITSPVELNFKLENGEWIVADK